MEKSTLANSRPGAVQNILGHIHGLDGIRGLAVLLVTLGHFQLTKVRNGFLGVDIFFTLSGFLITSMLVTEWEHLGYIKLKNFYIRRILRLYPALLVMLLIVSPITQAKPYILSSLFYSTNWVMALNILPVNLELGHTWTLAIEEQYYILWPVCLGFLLSRLTVRKIVTILLSFAAISFILRIFLWASNYDLWRFNAGMDAHADGLLLGSALGIIYVYNLFPTDPKALKIVSLLSGLSAIIGIGMFIFVNDLEIMVVFGSLLASFITLSLILYLLIFQSPIVRAIFENKILVFLGVISYGLYLWQVPILNLVNLSSFHLNPYLDSSIKLALILAFTLISFRYIERPIVRFKTYFKT